MTDHVTDRLYLAGRVERYCSWPVLRRQSVGEHSAALYNIYNELFGLPPAEVAYHIMNHDATELVVGDPPFPLKANNPDLKAVYTRLEAEAETRLGLQPPEIAPSEKLKLKVADLTEMFMFGLVEREMGNVLATPIVIRTREAAERLAAEMLSPSEHRTVVMFFEEHVTRHVTRMEELARLQ